MRHRVIALQRPLLQRYQQLSASSSSSITSDDSGRTQFAVYFEWIHSLSLLQPDLFRELRRQSPFFPWEATARDQDLVATSFDAPSALSTVFLHRLEDLWGSYQREESLPSLRLIREYYGLRRNIFPVDCAIEYDHEVIALLEFGSNRYHETGFDYESGEILLDNVDRLKESFYRVHYPSVPYWRMQLLRQGGDLEAEVMITMNKILQLILEKKKQQQQQQQEHHHQQ